MNKVVLMGRLTADPEVRYSQDGNGVARFTLAVDRRFAKSEQKTDFIRMVAFGKKAEFAEKYLQKGSKILTEGRIVTGSYKDKDGKTVYTTDITVEEIEFADSKKGDDVGSAAPVQNNGFMSIPEGVEEELPFN